MTSSAPIRTPVHSDQDTPPLVAPVSAMVTRAMPPTTYTAEEEAAAKVYFEQMEKDVAQNKVAYEKAIAGKPDRFRHGEWVVFQRGKCVCIGQTEAAAIVGLPLGIPYYCTQVGTARAMRETWLLC
jgi:hypothetical protein